MYSLCFIWVHVHVVGHNTDSSFQKLAYQFYFFKVERLLTCILKPSSNRSPYTFKLVQKVKHRVYKIHGFINEAILCQTLQVILFKKKWRVLLARTKLEKRYHHFLWYKIFYRAAINYGFCLFADVTDYHDLRRIYLAKKYSFDRTLRFCYTMT